MFQNHLSWLVVVCISKKLKIFFHVIYSGCSFNGKVVCKGVIARVSLRISFKFMFQSFLFYEISAMSRNLVCIFYNLDSSMMFKPSLLIYLFIDYHGFFVEILTAFNNSLLYQNLFQRICCF